MRECSIHCCERFVYTAKVYIFLCELINIGEVLHSLRCQCIIYILYGRYVLFSDMGWKKKKCRIYLSSFASFIVASDIYLHFVCHFMRFLLYACALNEMGEMANIYIVCTLLRCVLARWLRFDVINIFPIDCLVLFRWLRSRIVARVRLSWVRFRFNRFILWFS